MDSGDGFGRSSNNSALEKNIKTRLSDEIQ